MVLAPDLFTPGSHPGRMVYMALDETQPRFGAAGCWRTTQPRPYVTTRPARLAAGRAGFFLGAWFQVPENHFQENRR